MNLIVDFIFVANGCIELVVLIIFADTVGIQLINLKQKFKIFLSLTIHILISVLFLVLKHYFGNFIVILLMALYFFRFISAIYILNQHLNLRIIYLMVFCNLSMSLVSTNASSILEYIIGKDSNEVSPYVMISIRVTSLLVVLFIRRKSNRQRNASVTSIVPNYVYVLIILAIIFLSAMTSLVHYETDSVAMKGGVFIAIVTVLTVILICIVASLFLNVIAKQHFKTVSQMMEKQVELQINHYRELEKIDAEISRFRHDYTNHLQSILSLIQMNECSQAEEYILKLKKVKYKSDLHIFYTGNRLADAILSAKSSSLNENCQIEYSGMIPNSIENVDLCIILSNSLDNAIEACKKLSSSGVISVYATSQQGYFVFSIKNPTICSNNYYDIPTTSKDDKKQHGMGLYNIEEIVKKYGGQMKIKCENGFFELMITMKI